MPRRKAGMIIIIVVALFIIAGVLGLLRHADKNKAKPPAPPATTDILPKPPEKKSPEPAVRPRPKQIEEDEDEEEEPQRMSVRDNLPPKDKPKQTQMRYSETLKTENKDRQITPGIILKPGEGLSVKFSEEQKEEIILKKDKSPNATNNQYQMLWQRKY